MTIHKLSTYKVIAMTLFILFSLLSILLVILFISLIVRMNNYGGEMTDGFGIIISSLYLMHLTVFLIWSYRIYKLETLKQNTYFQLGLIFLLGLIMPYVFLHDLI